jgi:hypothetical protein
MAPYFAPEVLVELQDGLDDVHLRFSELRDSYVSRRFNSERSREFALYGFCRRLGTLVRAIDQVFELLPPEREAIPDRDEVMDATIAIHAFVFNTFGCLDNLAWVWVCEKEVRNRDGTELSVKHVGLGRGNRQVRESLPQEFRDYLDTRQDWFDHQKAIRDSLVHRIPLYIPPYAVPAAAEEEYKRLEQASLEALVRREPGEYDRLQEEQKALAFFRPWLAHSPLERPGTMLFHPQLIADYRTVDEFGRMLLEQLDR